MRPSEMPWCGRALTMTVLSLLRRLGPSLGKGVIQLWRLLV